MSLGGCGPGLLACTTGLRSTDAKTVRWEHVDFERWTVHRPKPKGGEDRAFTVPVAAFVLDLLRRRRKENGLLFPEGDGGWVFPSRRRSGGVSHVAEPKEQRYVRVESEVEDIGVFG